MSIGSIFGFGGSEIERQKASGITEIEKLYYNDLASLFSLGLAGVRNETHTRMKKGAYYWEIDDPQRTSVPLLGLAPLVISSWAQPVARTINRDNREQLREFEHIVKRVRKIFPLDSSDESLNIEIRRLWDSVKLGWVLCTQTYNHDTSVFGGWLRNQPGEIDEYLRSKIPRSQPSVVEEITSDSSGKKAKKSKQPQGGEPESAEKKPTSGTEKLPPIVERIRSVWTTARIKDLNDLLERIRIKEVTGSTDFYKKLDEVQVELMKAINSLIPGLGGNLYQEASSSSSEVVLVETNIAES